MHCADRTPAYRQAGATYAAAFECHEPSCATSSFTLSSKAIDTAGLYRGRADISRSVLDIFGVLRDLNKYFKVPLIAAVMRRVNEVKV